MRLVARALCLLDDLSRCSLLSTHRDHDVLCRLANAGFAEEVDDRASTFLARVSGLKKPRSFRILKKGWEALVGAPYACAGCSTGAHWFGRPLILRVERVDGKCTRFLCPNCYETEQARED